MEADSSNHVRRRGEPWALGSVVGYASANIFDRMAVVQADPLIGPVLRGLPSLALGIILMWKHRTLNQLRPSPPQYIGLRPILAFVAAGIISTFGLFFYYLAMSFGGVTITVPVQETYVIWGTLIAWIFLRERIHRYALGGVVLIFVGLVGLSLGQSRGQPISPHWYWAIPLALTTALTYGISGVLWRDGQLRGAHQSVAIFLQFITSVAVGFAGLLVDRAPFRFARGNLARPGGSSRQRSAFRCARDLLHVYRAAPDGGGACVRVLLAYALGGDLVCALLPARIPQWADADRDCPGVHRRNPDAGLSA